MVVDLTLKRTGVHRNCVQPFFEFLDLGRLFRIGKTKLPCLVDGTLIARFKLASVCCFVLCKSLFHLW